MEFSLPSEILFQIFAHLFSENWITVQKRKRSVDRHESTPMNSLFSCSQVCKQWFEVSNDDNLWKYIHDSYLTRHISSLTCQYFLETPALRTTAKTLSKQSALDEWRSRSKKPDIKEEQQIKGNKNTLWKSLYKKKLRDFIMAALSGSYACVLESQRRLVPILKSIDELSTTKSKFQSYKTELEQQQAHVEDQRKQQILNTSWNIAAVNRSRSTIGESRCPNISLHDVSRSIQAELQTIQNRIQVYEFQLHGETTRKTVIEKELEIETRIHSILKNRLSTIMKTELYHMQ